MPKLKKLPPTDPRHNPSLLEQFIAIIQAETGLHLSFDDLTGTETGAHNDIPEMRLHWNYQSHHCAFCNFAKRTPQGNMDCVKNKIAVNRLALRRRRGFQGFCHLGLFEMIEPLIYRNTVLGVFFFGSVRLHQQQAQSRRRLAHYCQRHGLNTESYLKQFNKLPVISALEIPYYHAMLRSVVSLALHLCESSGISPELYRRKQLVYPYLDPQNTPYLIKQTMTYIVRHLREPFIVKDIAHALKCHPDFLSRKFKEHTGLNLSSYLQDLRINRAKTLLRNPKINIDDVAAESGFSDRVHFSKVFLRITGQTPGQFRKQFTPLTVAAI